MSSNPAPKGHKRVRSADLMELDKLDSSFLPKMCTDLQEMKKKLDADHMLVKALEPAVENINSVLDSLKHIDAYKKKPENQGIAIAALSFSNIEERHLASLGVRQEEAPTSKVISQVNSFFNTSDRYRTISTFWNGDGQHTEGKCTLLAASVQNIAQTTSLVTEAGRRIIIDRLIQEVINFLMSLGMYTYLFPEIRLSIATDKPIPIRYTSAYANQRVRRYTTFLTGSVDYLVLGCGVPTAISDRISAEKRQEILSQRTLSSLTDQINGPLDKTFNWNHLRLLHVEAKREKEKQELKDYSPQAIGETLAMMEMTRKVHGVWCLTTGREWIFGLVAGNSGHQKAAYALDSMEIYFNSSTLQDDLRVIFFVLVYWFVADLEEIKNMLKTFAHH